jgi:acetylornithine/N-succinyldiaminopimelate aminotransferase
MDRTESLVETAQARLYPNYRQPPIVLSHGVGAELWDVSGKRYIDFFAGIAVSTLGHAHPRLTQAIAAQAQKLLHVSNYFYNEPNVLLADRLCGMSGMDRAFFCNSGTEAIEASLKLVRRHFHARGEVERFRVIAFDNSFHGRTLGALAATGQNQYREGFGPLVGVTHVPYGDAEAVQRAMGPDVAAILAEPVQGEGGVLVAPEGFLAALRSIADEAGACLVLDEVQTGIARTGRFLACEHDGVRPDVVALAKGLGGGLPIGAMLCRNSLESALPPGSHGSTFGGNPLASAAALAVLETIEQDGLVALAESRGARLAARLEELCNRYPQHVETRRGRGLLQALVMREGVDMRALLEATRAEGVLLTVAGGRGLRFSPPLVITEAELDEGIEALDKVLKARG